MSIDESGNVSGTGSLMYTFGVRRDAGGKKRYYTQHEGASREVLSYETEIGDVFVSPAKGEDADKQVTGVKLKNGRVVEKQGKKETVIKYFIKYDVFEGDNVFEGTNKYNFTIPAETKPGRPKFFFGKSKSEKATHIKIKAVWDKTKLILEKRIPVEKFSQKVEFQEQKNRLKTTRTIIKRYAGYEKPVDGIAQIVEDKTAYEVLRCLTDIMSRYWDVDHIVGWAKIDMKTLGSIEPIEDFRIYNRGMSEEFIRNKWIETKDALPYIIKAKLLAYYDFISQKEEFSTADQMKYYNSMTEILNLMDWYGITIPGFEEFFPKKNGFISITCFTMVDKLKEGIKSGEYISSNIDPDTITVKGTGRDMEPILNVNIDITTDEENQRGAMLYVPVQDIFDSKYVDLTGKEFIFKMQVPEEFVSKNRVVGNGLEAAMISEDKNGKLHRQEGNWVNLTIPGKQDKMSDGYNIFLEETNKENNKENWITVRMNPVDYKKFTSSDVKYMGFRLSLGEGKVESFKGRIKAKEFCIQNAPFLPFSEEEKKSFKGRIESIKKGFNKISQMSVGSGVGLTFTTYRLRDGSDYARVTKILKSADPEHILGNPENKELVDSVYNRVVDFGMDLQKENEIGNRVKCAVFIRNLVTNLSGIQEAPDKGAVEAIMYWAFEVSRLGYSDLYGTYKDLAKSVEVKKAVEIVKGMNNLEDFDEELVNRVISMIHEQAVKVEGRSVNGAETAITMPHAREQIVTLINAREGKKILIPPSETLRKWKGIFLWGYLLLAAIAVSIWTKRKSKIDSHEKPVGTGKGTGGGGPPSNVYDPTNVKYEAPPLVKDLTEVKNSYAGGKKVSDGDGNAMGEAIKEIEKAHSPRITKWGFRFLMLTALMFVCWAWPIAGKGGILWNLPAYELAHYLSWNKVWIWSVGFFGLMVLTSRKWFSDKVFTRRWQKEKKAAQAQEKAMKKILKGLDGVEGKLDRIIQSVCPDESVTKISSIFEEIKDDLRANEEQKYRQIVSFLGLLQERKSCFEEQIRLIQGISPQDKERLSEFLEIRDKVSEKENEDERNKENEQLTEKREELLRSISTIKNIPDLFKKLDSEKAKTAEIQASPVNAIFAQIMSEREERLENTLKNTKKERVRLERELEKQKFYKSVDENLKEEIEAIKEEEIRLQEGKKEIEFLRKQFNLVGGDNYFLNALLAKKEKVQKVLRNLPVRVPFPRVEEWVEDTYTYRNVFDSIEIVRLEARYLRDEAKKVLDDIEEKQYDARMQYRVQIKNLQMFKVLEVKGPEFRKITLRTNEYLDAPNEVGETSGGFVIGVFGDADKMPGSEIYLDRLEKKEDGKTPWVYASKWGERANELFAHKVGYDLTATKHCIDLVNSERAPSLEEGIRNRAMRVKKMGENEQTLDSLAARATMKSRYLWPMVISGLLFIVIFCVVYFGIRFLGPTFLGLSLNKSMNWGNFAFTVFVSGGIAFMMLVQFLKPWLLLNGMFWRDTRRFVVDREHDVARQIREETADQRGERDWLERQLTEEKESGVLGKRTITDYRYVLINAISETDLIKSIFDMHEIPERFKTNPRWPDKNLKLPEGIKIRIRDAITNGDIVLRKETVRILLESKKWQDFEGLASDNLHVDNSILLGKLAEISGDARVIDIADKLAPLFLVARPSPGVPPLAYRVVDNVYRHAVVKGDYPLNRTIARFDSNIMSGAAPSIAHVVNNHPQMQENARFSGEPVPEGNYPGEQLQPVGKPSANDFGGAMMIQNYEQYNEPLPEAWEILDEDNEPQRFHYWTVACGYNRIQTVVEYLIEEMRNEKGIYDPARILPRILKRRNPNLYNEAIRWNINLFQAQDIDREYDKFQKKRKDKKTSSEELALLSEIFNEENGIYCNRNYYIESEMREREGPAVMQGNPIQMPYGLNRFFHLDYNGWGPIKFGLTTPRHWITLLTTITGLTAGLIAGIVVALSHLSILNVVSGVILTMTGFLGGFSAGSNFIKLARERGWQWVMKGTATHTLFHLDGLSNWFSVRAMFGYTNEGGATDRKKTEEILLRYKRQASIKHSEIMQRIKKAPFFEKERIRNRELLPLLEIIRALSDLSFLQPLGEHPADDTTEDKHLGSRASARKMRVYYYTDPGASVLEAAGPKLFAWISQRSRWILVVSTGTVFAANYVLLAPFYGVFVSGLFGAVFGPVNPVIVGVAALALGFFTGTILGWGVGILLTRIFLRYDLLKMPEDVANRPKQVGWSNIFIAVLLDSGFTSSIFTYASFMVTFFYMWALILSRVFSAFPWLALKFPTGIMTVIKDATIYVNTWLPFDLWFIPVVSVGVGMLLAFYFYQVAHNLTALFYNKLGGKEKVKKGYEYYDDRVEELEADKVSIAHKVVDFKKYRQESIKHWVIVLKKFEDDINGLCDDNKKDDGEDSKEEEKKEETVSLQKVEEAINVIESSIKREKKEISQHIVRFAAKIFRDSLKNTRDKEMTIEDLKKSNEENINECRGYVIKAIDARIEMLKEDKSIVEEGKYQPGILTFIFGAILTAVGYFFTQVNTTMLLLMAPGIVLMSAFILFKAFGWNIKIGTMPYYYIYHMKLAFLMPFYYTPIMASAKVVWDQIRVGQDNRWPYTEKVLPVGLDRIVEKIYYREHLGTSKKEKLMTKLLMLPKEAIGEQKDRFIPYWCAEGKRHLITYGAAFFTIICLCFSLPKHDFMRYFGLSVTKAAPFMDAFQKLFFVKEFTGKAGIGKVVQGLSVVAKGSLWTIGIITVLAIFLYYLNNKEKVQKKIKTFFRVTHSGQMGNGDIEVIMFVFFLTFSIGWILFFIGGDIVGGVPGSMKGVVLWICISAVGTVILLISLPVIKKMKEIKYQRIKHKAYSVDPKDIFKAASSNFSEIGKIAIANIRKIKNRDKLIRILKLSAKEHERKWRRDQGIFKYKAKKKTVDADYWERMYGEKWRKWRKWGYDKNSKISLIAVKTLCVLEDGVIGKNEEKLVELFNIVKHFNKTRIQVLDNLLELGTDNALKFVKAEAKRYLTETWHIPEDIVVGLCDHISLVGDVSAIQDIVSRYGEIVETKKSRMTSEGYYSTETSLDWITCMPIEGETKWIDPTFTLEPISADNYFVLLRKLIEDKKRLEDTVEFFGCPRKLQKISEKIGNILEKFSKEKMGMKELEYIKGLIEEMHSIVYKSRKIRERYEKIVKDGLDEHSRDGYKDIFNFLKNYTLISVMDKGKTWSVQKKTVDGDGAWGPRAKDENKLEILLDRLQHMEYAVEGGEALLRKSFGHFEHSVYGRIKMQGDILETKPNLTADKLKLLMKTLGIDNLTANDEFILRMGLALHDYGRGMEGDASINVETGEIGSAVSPLGLMHRDSGVYLADGLLTSLGADGLMKETVKFLIKHHASPWDLYAGKKYGEKYAAETTLQGISSDLDALLDNLEKQQLLPKAMTREKMRDTILVMLAVISISDIYASGDRYLSDAFLSSLEKNIKSIKIFQQLMSELNNISHEDLSYGLVMEIAYNLLKENDMPYDDPDASYYEIRSAVEDSARQIVPLDVYDLSENIMLEDKVNKELERIGEERWLDGKSVLNYKHEAYSEKIEIPSGTWIRIVSVPGRGEYEKQKQKEKPPIVVHKEKIKSEEIATGKKLKTEHDKKCRFSEVSRQALFSVKNRDEIYDLMANINAAGEDHMVLKSREVSNQLLDSTNKIGTLFLMAKRLGEKFQGLYNSPKAAASVYHFHGQFTKGRIALWENMREGTVQIDWDEKYKDYHDVKGGYLKGWPLSIRYLEGKYLSDIVEALQIDINDLIQKDIPHNLIYVYEEGKYKVLIMPKKNEATHTLTSEGKRALTVGGYEAGGDIIVPNENDVKYLTEDKERTAHLFVKAMQEEISYPEWKSLLSTQAEDKDKKLPITKENSAKAFSVYLLITVGMFFAYLIGYRGWFVMMPLAGFSVVTVLLGLQTADLYDLLPLHTAVGTHEEGLIAPFRPKGMDVLKMPVGSDLLVYVKGGITYVNVEKMEKRHHVIQWLHYFHEWLHLKGIESHIDLYAAQGLLIAGAVMLFIGAGLAALSQAGVLARPIIVLGFVFFVSRLFPDQKVTDEAMEVKFGTGEMSIIKDYLRPNGTINLGNFTKTKWNFSDFGIPHPLETDVSSEQKYPKDIGAAGIGISEYRKELKERATRDELAGERFLLLELSETEDKLSYNPRQGGNVAPVNGPFWEALNRIEQDKQFKAFLRKNRELLKNLKIYLLEAEPGSKEVLHPHLVMCKNGRWQAAFSRTREGRGPAVYMTRAFFEDMPRDIVLGTLYNQIVRAILLLSYWKMHVGDGTYPPRGEHVPEMQEFLNKIVQNKQPAIIGEINRAVQYEIEQDKKLKIDKGLTDLLSDFLKKVETEWGGGIFSGVYDELAQFRGDIDKKLYNSAIEHWGNIGFYLSALSKKDNKLGNFIKINNHMSFVRGISGVIDDIFRRFIEKYGIRNNNGLAHGRRTGRIVVVRKPEDMDRYLLEAKGDEIWVIPELPGHTLKGRGVIVSSFEAGHAMEAIKEAGVPVAIVPNAIKLLSHFNNKIGMFRVYAADGDTHFRLANEEDIHHEEHYVPEKPVCEDRIFPPKAVVGGDSKLVFDLDEVDRFYTNRVGSKAANLGEMISNGLKDNVPPGAVFTFEFSDRFLRTPDADGKSLYQKIEDKMVGIKDDYGRILLSADELKERLAIIRDMIIETSMDMPELAKLKKTVLDEVKQLRKDHGDLYKNKGFYVRSSFNFEDLPTASAAGHYESYPDHVEFTEVRTDEQVIEAVKRVIAQKYSYKAFLLRLEHKVSDRDVYPAVLLQVPVGEISENIMTLAEDKRMERAFISGVMYTHNPVSENPGEICIFAGKGSGAVVSSQGKSAWARIDKYTGRVREISNLSRIKNSKLNIDGKIVDMPVDTGIGDKNKDRVMRIKMFNDEFVSRLAELGKKIEAMNHYWTQVIEWIASPDGKIYIVQTRPVVEALPHAIGEVTILFTQPYDEQFPLVTDNELEILRMLRKTSNVDALIQRLIEENRGDGVLYMEDNARLAERVILLEYLGQLLLKKENRAKITDIHLRKLMKFAANEKNIFTRSRAYLILSYLNDTLYSERIKTFINEESGAFFWHGPRIDFAEAAARMRLYEKAVKTLEEVRIKEDKSYTLCVKILSILEKYIQRKEAFLMLQKLIDTFPGKWPHREAQILMVKIVERSRLTGKVMKVEVMGQGLGILPLTKMRGLQTEYDVDLKVEDIIQRETIHSEDGKEELMKVSEKKNVKELDSKPKRVINNVLEMLAVEFQDGSEFTLSVSGKGMDVDAFINELTRMTDETCDKKNEPILNIKNIKEKNLCYIKPASILKKVAKKYNVVMGVSEYIYYSNSNWLCSLEDRFKVKIVPLKNASREVMMKELAEKAEGQNILTALLLDVDLDNMEEMEDLISEYMDKGRKDIISLQHPEVTALTEATLKRIEDIHELYTVAGITAKILPSIKSLDAGKSIYSIRVSSAYMSNRIDYSQAAKPYLETLKRKEEATRNRRYMVTAVDEFIDLEFLAEAIKERRELMEITKDKQDPVIDMVIVRNQKVEENLQEILKIAGLDKYLTQENIITFADERKMFTLQEVLGEIENKLGIRPEPKQVIVGAKAGIVKMDLTAPDNMLLSDSENSILLVQMKKGGLTSQLYRMMIEIMANNDSIPKTGIKGDLQKIPGLNLFIYLPEVDVIDLNAEVREYERYVLEALVKV
ncbi:MAG: PEP/pyruvate-binding domain-containing protein [Candidatus Omnitrophota bacterium]